MRMLGCFLKYETQIEKCKVTFNKYASPRESETEQDGIVWEKSWNFQRLMRAWI